jgi:hypothetical protein
MCNMLLSVVKCTKLLAALYRVLCEITHVTQYTLLCVNKRTSLVPSEAHHLVIANNTRVNKMARRLVKRKMADF